MAKGFDTICHIILKIMFFIENITQVGLHGVKVVFFLNVNGSLQDELTVFKCLTTAEKCLEKYNKKKCCFLDQYTLLKESIK